METLGFNFIVTFDEEVRKSLLANGLLEISNKDNQFIFVNEPKKIKNLNFDKGRFGLTNSINF